MVVAAIPIYDNSLHGDVIDLSIRLRVIRTELQTDI